MGEADAVHIRRPEEVRLHKCDTILAVCIRRRSLFTELLWLSGLNKISIRRFVLIGKWHVTSCMLEVVTTSSKWRDYAGSLVGINQFWTREYTGKNV